MIKFGDALAVLTERVGLARFVLIASALVLSGCLSRTDDYSVLNDPDSEWEVVFQDEFEGFGVPDESKWIRQEYNRRKNSKGPDGWWLRENVELDGYGNLVIRTTIIENRNPHKDDDPYDYASGMVSTEGLFEQAFGRYEARIKLPRSPGWWIGFWLFADSVHNEDGSGVDGTEIDIVEAFGWTDEISHALHWDGYKDNHKSVGKRVWVPGVRKRWHTFALEWDEDGYVWFVDGRETWRSRAGGVSREPSWVKLSSEISTSKLLAHKYWANAIKNDQLPDHFKVDWVRVYKRKQDADTEAVLTGG